MLPKIYQQTVIDTVCKAYSTTYEQVLKDVNSKNYADTMTRQVIVYFLSTKCLMPLLEISRVIKKNHPTQLYSIKKITNICETDKNFAMFINKLGSEIDSKFSEICY